MKKTILYIVLAMLCLIFEVKAQSQPILLTGQLSDLEGKAILNATIQIKGEKTTALSNAEGKFIIKSTRPTGKLIVSHIGYETIELDFNGKSLKPFSIILKEDNSQLNEVEIVSTGYQHIPKERATGSFVLIDSALLNRKVSANIIDRLDGVTSGLIFNRGGGVNVNSNKSDITIRGRSTIFANPNPLIVLDNFPFDGDINSINPNDIENISILKDAAAASIWGVMAGNGVIVITTKKGRRNSEPILNLSSNLTISDKPNLWYPAQMSSTDYIELERLQFDKGVYNNALANSYAAITPAVSLMDKLKKNQISEQEYHTEINKLKEIDVMEDLNRYFYRNAVTQQYSLNISGGNARQKYYISGGYDKNLDEQVPDSYKRMTVNASNTYNFFKDKLELFNTISITKSNTKSNTSTSNYNPSTPYQELADQKGNALAVTDFSGLRPSYIDTAGKGELLDWNYRPLDERNPNRAATQLSYRFLTSLTYKITSYLKLQGYYQYEKGSGDNVVTNLENSFYTRDFINRYTTVNSLTGVVNRVVPIGQIISSNRSNSDSQYARTQLIYQNNIKGKHNINAIAGFEIKDFSTESFSQTYYGFDPLTKTNTNATINPMARYAYYYNPAGGGSIGTSPSQLGSIDRAISYYTNASYAYNNKYILSISARKDKANIFGVKSNQKGVPLWSTGAAWNINMENFYNVDKLPILKLRFTYGYNGNTDKSTSAYLTSRTYGFATLAGVVYSQVVNPPNPALSWERVQNINFGMDFGLKNHWLTGSLEYYVKNGKDLIGESPIAPQTGIISFKGNTADTKATGLDLMLNVNLINNKDFQWVMNILYSYSSDKTTGYKQIPSTNRDLVINNYANPLVGYPYHSVFVYKSAGLDASGNPIGYLNGEVSTAYATMMTSKNRDDIQFMGSGTPTSFGSIRNTVNYKNYSLSFNIIYKLNYYFRRSGVFSGSIYTFKQSDFTSRWQEPGDEQHTSVPSLIYPANATRDLFYQSSADIVEKGDHVRLQDIRLSYRVINSNTVKLPFKNLQFYTYMNNLGIIWAANKRGIDPDAGTLGLPATLSFSIGLNANF